ncbi:MAG TPA: septal ring lytic transglycosylase RlpA family protein [Candidatus Angelobacter sp.]|jgi:rare lipoprotein A|nr:septal ring lytic transglycosylase RlpA family protein [Candidatus Angelobacter sp.]
MKRVLSILAAASLSAANVGAAPVPNHRQQPQNKTATDSKVAGSPKTEKSQKSPKAVAAKPATKPYQVGNASWYGKQFHGKETASGEDFDMFELTAAHRHLPLGTYVKVTNLRNGKWVIVRVNDRGPYVGNRIMDLSYSAARMLNFYGGIEKVRIDLVQPTTMAVNQPAVGAP